MAKTAKRVNIPLNRVEGDLEIAVEVVDGRVTDAWSSGTMFRGFESMMRGRGALDGLVMTPRVCGICSITHLTAAVLALDAIAGVTPPDNAIRLRNLALMVETMQNDVRQSILMFMADFANKDGYAEHPMAGEAMERYQPLAGRTVIQVVRESKWLVQALAIFGGQWPHTSFMVPGGVTSIPDVSKLLQCRIIIERFKAWYERSILGCTVERWQEVRSEEDLAAWLDESPAHLESELGFFLRFCRIAEIDRLGRGPNRFLSYGNFPLPSKTLVIGADNMLLPAGIADGASVAGFDAGLITEDLSHAWYEQGAAPQHPFVGKTKPYASGQSGLQYSWIKAPRYHGQVVETGPLAESLVAGTPLFCDLLAKNGPNAMVRQLARLVRPAGFFAPMAAWLSELVAANNEPFYHSVRTIPDGQAAGLLEAARGALGHWVKIKGDKIEQYQIITPTAWNGSPRDEQNHRGAWEEALIGTPIKDVANPIEAGHVVRSFDPCLVCAVHSVVKGRPHGRVRVGFPGW